jgi:predicted deacylase
MQSGLLMAGTRYQTAYFIKTGEQPGPTIVVIGGLHGDEPAGYLAARELKKWKILSGKLVLVPDSNIEAIRRNVRFYGRNMNRLFLARKTETPCNRSRMRSGSSPGTPSPNWY